MLRLARAFALMVAPAALAVSGSRPVSGTWHLLPAAPIAPDVGLTSVWTGSRMLVFGRETSRAEDGAVLKSVDVAAAYDPSANAWRRLAPPGRTGSFMGYGAVWTGKEMLVWGQGTREAFDPLTNGWRLLPRPALAAHDATGLMVRTGREMIGWGGGCCGDALPTARPTTRQRTPGASWLARRSPAASHP